MHRCVGALHLTNKIWHLKKELKIIMVNNSVVDSDADAAFKARIVLQHEKVDVLKAFEDECMSPVLDELKTPQLQSKLDVIEDTWASFKSAHDQIATDFPQLYIASNYCKNRLFAQTLASYAASHSRLLAEIDARSTALAQVGKTSVVRPSPGTSAYHLFEKLKLRPFSGKYQDWKEFEDMFQALVGNTDDIPPVHKMTVLKSSVLGEAARLIGHMKVTGENFPVAWSMLVARYENKRLLVSAQLDKLFGDSTVVSSSSDGIHGLLSGVTEALDALKALGAQVDTWDYPIVYHLVRRLNPTIRKEWERKLGSNTDYPSLQVLQDFLRSEAMSLESIELTSGESSKVKSHFKLSNTASNSKQQQKPTTGRSYATTAQTKLEASTQQPRQDQTSSAQPLKPWMKGVRGPNDPGHTCDCCGSQQHFLGPQCSIFMNRTAEERFQFIKQCSLCYNCLGRHAVSACRNIKRCRNCNMKHHTLIHEGIIASRQAPNSSANPDITPTQSTTSQQIGYKQNSTSL